MNYYLFMDLFMPPPRIEGLEVGARRLLRTEAARELGERTVDVTAAEVLGNIDAMNSAVHSIGAGDTITLDTLLDFHRRLLAGTRLAGHAGRLRETPELDRRERPQPLLGGLRSRAARFHR